MKALKLGLLLFLLAGCTAREVTVNVLSTPCEMIYPGMSSICGELLDGAIDASTPSEDRPESAADLENYCRNQRILFEQGLNDSIDERCNDIEYE